MGILKPSIFHINEMEITGKTRMADILDGTSNTAMIGEKHYPKNCKNTSSSSADALRTCYDGDIFFWRGYVQYNSIRDLNTPLGEGPNDVLSLPYSFGSWHPGVCNFVMGDGSVRAISNTTAVEVLCKLGDRRDGQVVVLP